MMIKFSHRLQIRFVAALVVLGLVAGFAGSAGASGPSPTPNGYCGALNMHASDTMMDFSSGPMSHDGTPGLTFFELQGNVGMFNAVDVSGCS